MIRAVIGGYPRRVSRLSGTTLRHALVAGIETGLAAGCAWWIADAVLPTSTPAYAPVAAVAVLGGGYDRRMERVRAMLGGMTVAIVLSEIAVRALPDGVIAMAAVTATAIVVARLLLDDTLAVVYAGFNAPILFGLGGEGWLPERGIEAVIGAFTAYFLVYLIFPPRAIRHARRSIVRQVSSAVDSLRLAAAALDPIDQREPMEADDLSEAIDRNVDAMNDTLGFSFEVARFSPWRWNQRQEIERACERVRRLQPFLRTATTAVRAADRLAADGPHMHLSEAFRLAADLVAAVGAVASDGESERRGDAVERVRDSARQLSAHVSSDFGSERSLQVAVTEFLQLLAGDARETVTELLQDGGRPSRHLAAPANVAGDDGVRRD